VSRWTNAPFVDELPRLLRDRGISVRALARQVEVSDAHLSRVLRGVGYKRVSPELARKIALSLGLDEGYFVETREGFVADRLKADPALRDSLYRRLRFGR
jgi:transcriptional regulator with XRE-family HTH domain